QPPPQQEADDLLTSLKKLSLSEPTEPPKPLEAQRIEVIQRGTTIPTTRTAEVKSRSGAVQLSKVIPQLWIGRTPHLRIGIHTMGKFTRVESINVAEKFQEWERTYQTPLLKMVRLISELREVVKEHGNCAAVCNHEFKPPRLEIF